MSLLHQAPHFSCEEITTLSRQLFAIDGVATPLPSERDQNFHLSASTGEQYVLKIANASESFDLLEAQNQAMKRVSNHSATTLTHQVISSLAGEEISIIVANGSSHFVRLLTWLPGTPLGTVKHQSSTLLHDLGRLMGEINVALGDFAHPALQRDFHWDVANAPRILHQYKDEIADPARRAIIEQFLSRFDRHWMQWTIKLRRGVIHGDANDYNVLVDPGAVKNPFTRFSQISGVLDFGDMVHSFLVCEPAIAAAYALLDKEEPLQAASTVVRGYHSANPLTEAEADVIFDLICARLCMSVCHAAHQHQANPSNDYLLISQTPAWAALAKLSKVHPTFATCVMRDACGLPAHPHTDKIISFLQNQAANFKSVIDADTRRAPATHIDWSVGSPLFGSDKIGLSVAETTQYLFATIKAQGAEFGHGGYDEARLVYAGDAFATDDNPTGERRTIHIGVDLFLPAGATIYAPLAGKVHSFHNNDKRYDYGPIILLEHYTTDGTPFFTLYGHLSLESLAGLRVGQPIAAGERIGWIGAPPINGDWPPHLHLQIIVDHLGASYDFNGVAPASQRAIWLGLCPDPNLILGIPAERFPAKAPSKEATLAERKQRIGRNMSISYQQPLKMVRGLGQFLYDETGRAYLDGVNNVAHVGHCHPQVVRAGQRQMAVLNTNTRYLHDSINEFAQRLAATLPEPLSVCFFVCSGSEANELALRLARAHTRQFDMICVDAGYHGHTQALIEVSPYKHNGQGGRGAPPWVQMAEMPDPYRGRFKGYSAESGANYAKDVQACVARIQEQGRGVAGFICESMIGCGGQIVLPDGYMGAAFAHVRAAGGVCIADEVQVGFGRAGSYFWGFQTQGVIPDIVTMGKPIGNGHPVAAVVTTPEIAASFANGMEYFNTFGGNAVSCEIGLAVLDVIENEGLQANALRIGNRIMEGIRALMPKHPLIGDVRGLGLYIGIELVLDGATLEPAGEHASYVSNRMKDYGILISTDGPYHNVLKIKPPLVWTEADADHLVRMVDKVLVEDAVLI